MRRTLTVKKIVVVHFFIIIFLALGQVGWAQYPTKPITLVVCYAPGGTTDITARPLADAASKFLGQPIIVVNKPGGGGAVALTSLKNEKPDGYTLCTIPGSAILIQHQRKVPYDATKDFTSIIKFSETFAGVVVRADSPWKTFKELLSDAKAHPGKIKYGTSGAGSFHHLLMERLAIQEGIKWIHMPFPGDHPAITAVLGGHADVMACSGFSAYVDSGQMKILSTYMPKRYPRYPDVPTWVELGYKISGTSFAGIVGPKNIPLPIVDKLYKAFKEAMENTEFKKAMDATALIIPLSPEELANDIREMSDEWGPIIKQLGFK